MFPFPILQSSMSLLSRGYPLKYRRSTGDMANGVVVGPSPLGDRFISIKYERGGSVVHHGCAPLANITFPIAVPAPKGHYFMASDGKGR